MAWKVSKERFGRIVEEALADVPEPFFDALRGIRIEVRNRPSRKLLREVGVPPGETLLGLYQGRPETRRSVEDSGTLPDVILVFQEPLEELCDDEGELMEEVRRTVLHELGHHYGLDEEGLDELGYG